MIINDSNGKFYYSTLINSNNITSGFGTRLLGDGRDPQVVESFLNSQSVTYSSIVIPDQVHSANIELISSESINTSERIETTDGLICSVPNTILTVVTADCVPILFSDEKNSLIGISHQGWRGSLKRLSQRMIDGFIAKGADLKTIKVAIGPAIGMCCYTIFGDRYYEFLSEFEPWMKLIFHERGGVININLNRLNYLQLIEKGIPAEHIDFFPFCTKCDSHRFYSFQRDVKKHYGEMVSFIVQQ